MTQPDDFGIVSRNTERRAMYGDRRCHGTVATATATERPVLGEVYRRPPMIRRPPPVVASRPAPPAAVASVSVGDVLAAVAEVWGVSREDILGKQIAPRIMAPRKAAYLLLRRLTPLSLPALARAVCRADHSIVVRQLRKAGDLHEHDAGWRERYERAEAAVTAARA